MSANKKSPLRRHPFAEPIDIETYAPYLVNTLINIKLSCLRPYLDDENPTIELGAFKVDSKYIPDAIIEELMFYQQYLLLCEQLDEQNQFWLHKILLYVCSAFFKHGYNMALDADANEFSHFIP